MVKAIVVVDGQYLGTRLFGSRQALRRYRDAVRDVTSHLLIDNHSGVYLKDDALTLALSGCPNDHAVLRLIRRQLGN